MSDGGADGHDDDRADHEWRPKLDPHGPADDGPAPAGSQDSLRLYKRELEPQPLDARVELARQISGLSLHALCHDPSPRVAQALLDNESFGLEHARRLAAHHRSGVGLEALARNSEFLRDLQVQRHLFRNPQITENILRRIFGRYRLAQIYQLGVSHDVSAKVRNLAKKAFRRKFPDSSAEERVRLILKTEGRCLALLVGIALGAKASALLARRPLASTLLIRNLARWPSTTPPVLENMSRQPVVRRSPQLAGIILQHPNAPSRLRSRL